MKIEDQYRLNDEQMMDFVVLGYHLVELDLPDGLNEEICDELDQLEENPLDTILDVVPQLQTVFTHPQLEGALVSILGDDFELSSHRHWHLKPPQSRYMHWHQDGINDRQVTEIRTLLMLYYPQDVEPDMGPTIVVPGSHFRNAPTDRMSTYYNIKGQLPLTVKAGTVAVTVYSLWHGTAANTTDKKRHMIKVPVGRQSDPAEPSWNHDSDGSNELVTGGKKGGQNSSLGNRRTVPSAQSEFYKERRLRRMTWDWLCGRETT